MPCARDAQYRTSRDRAQTDDGFDHRRAQAWALEYEQEQGRIHCQQRLKDPAQREQSPPRNIWIGVPGK